MTKESFEKVKWYKGIKVLINASGLGINHQFDVVSVNFEHNWIEVNHPFYKVPYKVYYKRVYMPYRYMEGGAE